MSNDNTQLVPVEEPTGILSERMRYAQALASASLLPKSYQRQPANILLAMEYGHALGLDTITAIQSVHVIDGKPTASAQLIGGLVRRAGHRLRVTGDDSHAIAEIVRKDDPDFVFRSEWTITRAQAAGLAGRGSWKTYPAAMLKARAITEVARDACPEALAGVAYTAEELGADTTPATTWPTTEPVIEDGEIVYAAPEPATKEQLQLIAVLFKKINIEDRDLRHEMVDGIIGREGASASLTKTEASEVIDHLKEVETPEGASE